MSTSPYTPHPDQSNAWIGPDGALFVGREGQPLASLLAEFARELAPGYVPPPPPPAPIIVPMDVLMERATEEEADALDKAMRKRSVKFRRAWDAARELREGTDLWSAVRAEAATLFGEERAAAILAP